MLFDRFIFVLYILLCYVWFLLGTIYETPFRYLSIVSMIISLATIIIVSFCQLQTLINQTTLKTHDKWSTIAWSTVHIALCGMLCLDGLEWVNPVVIFGLCGLLMTLAIIVVGGCACFVIMNNGDDWHAHIHLICILFWVMVQYMDVRLPAAGFHFVTALPIALMTCVRCVSSPFQGHILLWIIALIFHILRDTGDITPETFYWLLTSIVLLMATVHWKNILIISCLPIVLLFVSVWIMNRKCCGVPIQESVVEVTKLYNEIMAQDLELMVIPLDGESSSEDWDERL